ncbi:MAG TPA: hypothetical protein PL001_12045, partial [Candidatus Kryptobacter bacterium]|nr:hypothetical protein [Candidatus Kryptobacter bacterium]
DKRLWEVPTENGHWNTDWPYVAFHSANVPVAGFDGDKESFLGMYGSIRNPASVQAGKLGGITGKWPTRLPPFRWTSISPRARRK